LKSKESIHVPNAYTGGIGLNASGYGGCSSILRLLRSTTVLHMHRAVIIENDSERAPVKMTFSRAPTDRFLKRFEKAHKLKLILSHLDSSKVQNAP
jgi:hypothetical protein